MADEFEEAVLLAWNPRVPDALKAKANEYCQRVKDSPEAWRFCLERLLTTGQLEVKFFCLQLLQDVVANRLEALSDDDRSKLKVALFRWLSEHLPKTPEIAAVKNKVALVMVLIFKQEFPERWPSFFTDLLSCLSLGTALIDMFLRVLKMIDEEVVSREVTRSQADAARNTLIKDRMRDTVVKQLAATWYSILDTYAQSAPDLCKDCLEVIKLYTSWIDINLVANDQFLGKFYAFMTQTELLREGAGECLLEIVSKGVAEPMAKLSLLSKLKLPPVLQSIPLDGDDDEEFLLQLARTIDAMGLEILRCLGEIAALVANGQAPPEAAVNARAMLDETLELLFKFMAHDDDDVSKATFAFAGAYLRDPLRGAPSDPKLNDRLLAFLQIVRRKMKYNETFTFDKKDEDERATFAEYRKDLGVIYRAIGRLNAELTGTFVQSTINQAISNFASSSFADIEAALQLFYLLGDGVNEKVLEPLYVQLLVALSNSNLSMHPHQQVTLVYFDTIVHYAKYIPPNPEVFKNILISFLDGRGIRHPNPTLKSRACYLFLRLVKSQLTQLQPFLDSILLSLKDFLTIGWERPVPFEDQLHLFEAVGALVGSLCPPAPRSASGAPPAAPANAALQRQYLESILNPLMAQIEGILSQGLYKQDTPEQPVFSTFIIQIISAIGMFSKGFNGQPGESGAFFKRTLEVVRNVITAIPNSGDVRIKMMFYMHRMIECLGNDVFQYVSAVLKELMINIGSFVALSKDSETVVKDWMEFVRLLNQLMARFKEQMFPLMDELLMQVVGRFFSLVSMLEQQRTATSEATSVIVSRPRSAPGTSASVTTSELEREILDVRKNYYAFLSTLVTSNLSHVLTSPANQPHLNNILRSVLQGVVENPDPSSSKICTVVLKKLIEQWAGPSSPAFNKFVYEEVVPVLIKEPFKPLFDLTDGQTSQVLLEMVQIQKVMLAKCGAEFVEFLRAVLLPSLQFPSDIAERYIQFLQTASPKDFRQFFSSFVAMWKNSVR